MVSKVFGVSLPDRCLLWISYTHTHKLYLYCNPKQWDISYGFHSSTKSESNKIMAKIYWFIWDTIIDNISGWTGLTVKEWCRNWLLWFKNENVSVFSNQQEHSKGYWIVSRNWTTTISLNITSNNVSTNWIIILHYNK